MRQPNKNVVEPLATDREFEKLLVRAYLHACTCLAEYIHDSPRMIFKYLLTYDQSWLH